ncbi:putative plays a central role in 2-thiolation of mcm(5)S(2)U at tRNA wobble positions of tRNA(Lys), tRNA(Glu) and tRNA(Gln) [Lyophyllum shimeji]|uniref:Cytoplasmic tRNA 2-thiolation protein 2 n=1 Tax=Lyophyllum shimeji TaxID=47721 RepID=A0A9P3PQX7_LYOSH|nr:putative plays a central role in 2-thiolation of mcm(5)S(2)U at tRNA wobble positions of tRNA(Lys), tRNA(Glu) and tRNA(Gln) [Lyophyllum shimeji]
MLRRPKYDKSKKCVRCKEKSGNIVIRHAVYCKECFFPLIAVKFRRALDPSINPVPDGPRRKGLKAGGNLLLGLSGGLGSTVLLDLVDRTYFSIRAPPMDETTGKPRGGKDHPRNANVWPKGYACYVETCNAFPGTRDRTEEIRAMVAKYDRFEFLPLRVEDAFSRAWWDKIGGQPVVQSLGIDVTSEDLLLSSISSDEDVDTPTSRLQRYISSLPTLTAIPTAVQTLTRLLLLHTALSLGSSHLLLGTSLTSLSISLISSISQGGGFVVREEAQEEWISRLPVTRRIENGHADGAIRIIRPLRDIGMKECAMWAWWHGLQVVGREKVPGGKQGIGSLTKEFIVGLERDYPSTVSTIARTCAKLAPKKGVGGVCLLCERPAQFGLQDWKARISIRSFKDSSASGSYRPAHFPDKDIAPAAPETSRSPSLTPVLCYSCHTTLTSRSSRGTTAVSASKDNPMPLPMWVTSNLTSAASHAAGDEVGGFTDPSDELWERRKMDTEQMKATVADFLLEK